MKRSLAALFIFALSYSTFAGEVYSLVGKFDGTEYRFRLYTLGDKYVFHIETWRNGKNEQVDMSYLIRI